MAVLHPIFTLLFVFLVLYSIAEVNGRDKKSTTIVLWIVGIFMILAIGLRKSVGADYPVYEQMYYLYFPTLEISELIDKGLFRDTNIEIEWLYIMLNKLVFFFGIPPFFVLTLISAIITISIKFISYFKNSAYPIFSILLFLIPAYFIADSGHMRQALGMVFCLASFKYIKNRNVWMYLMCIYVAIGFHKSTIIFLPMYWIATVVMNPTRIFGIIAISILLSPLQIYNYFSSVLDTVDIKDLSAGYKGYISYEAEGSLFSDVSIVVYSLLLLVFNEVASKKIYYYEYMRNIVLSGICLYFIMRENPVFSTRLVGSFLGFIPLVIPNIIASIDNERTKRILFFYFIAFSIFYYFVFAAYQGASSRFTPDSYNNFLWSK